MSWNDEPAFGTTAIQTLARRAEQDVRDKRQETFDAIYDRLGQEGLTEVVKTFGRETGVDVSRCAVLSAAALGPRPEA